MPANPLGLNAALWKTELGAGIRLSDAAGRPLADSLIDKEILAATRWVERRLGIRFYDKNEFPDGIRFKTPESGDIISPTANSTYDEAVDAANFDVNYFSDARFMHMTLDVGPVLGVDRLALGYPNRPSPFVIPADWITLRGREREVQVVPGLGGFGPSYALVAQYMPGSLLGGSIPSSVMLSYRAGMEKLIVDSLYPELPLIIMRKAGLAILVTAQNLIDPGFQSKSNSIDGVSQSRSLTQNSNQGLYQNIIDQWQKMVDLSMKDFDETYNGVKMTVIA